MEYIYENENDQTTCNNINELPKQKIKEIVYAVLLHLYKIQKHSKLM